MRPLPAWPTNTFQSPKVATRAGLAGSSFFSDLGAGLAGLAAAAAGGAKGAGGAYGRSGKPNGAKGRKDETRHQQQSFEPGLALGPPAGGLPCRPIGAKFRPFALPGRAPGLQSCIWLLKNE